MQQSQLREHIQAAALQGDLGLLERLAESFGVASVRLDGEPQELTTLHYACSVGCMEVVDFLLSHTVNADPCAARSNAFTPLHAAATNGHADTCRLLLSKGAAVNAQTSPQGYSPLHSASFAGHLDTVIVLLESGADKSLRNYRGETPMQTAQRTGQLEVVRFLGGADDT